MGGDAKHSREVVERQVGRRCPHRAGPRMERPPTLTGASPRRAEDSAALHAPPADRSGRAGLTARARKTD